MGELGKEISNLIEDQHTDNEDQNIFNKQEHLDLDPCFRQFQYIYIYIYMCIYNIYTHIIVFLDNYFIDRLIHRLLYEFKWNFSNFNGLVLDEHKMWLYVELIFDFTSVFFLNILFLKCSSYIF